LYNILIESGLEINADKPRHMIMPRHPNLGQDQNIRTLNE